MRWRETKERREGWGEGKGRRKPTARREGHVGGCAMRRSKQISTHMGDEILFLMLERT